MGKIVIDAAMVKVAFLSAAATLDAKKDWINELNVFPVPDGDTGTNMTLTITSAANEVASLSNADMVTVCKSISSGSLRGARGNSGVILSQLLRGFTNSIKDYKTLDVEKIALAFKKASETAYKAVMKPKEGTILTVAREMSELAVELSSNCDNLEEFLKAILDKGDESLANTPNLLPVLKQAGVVDSGGQGLMVIMHGAFDALLGNPAEFKGMSASGVSGHVANVENIDTADIKFGYCTEFIINAEFTEKDESDFKEFLNSIGDSIVCVALDDIVKVHVHTNDPGIAISKALKYGPLSRMKIDNMREEHNEIYKKEIGPAPKSNQPKKKYYVISVSAGDGLNDIFGQVGVDKIISGGQTMNPSTDDFVSAIEEANAENVYILPNNKNIILAANQAKDIVDSCKVFVIPTKSIQQGIAAMTCFNPDGDPQENSVNMEEAAENINDASVTYAVRDTFIDGFDIQKDDIMVIGKGGLLAVEKDIETAVTAAMEKLVDYNAPMVTLYYGEGVSEEAAQSLAENLSEIYTDADIAIEFGGQPVYYYFISVE